MFAMTRNPQKHVKSHSFASFPTERSSISVDQVLQVFHLSHFKATPVQLEALGQALTMKKLQTLEISGVREVETPYPSEELGNAVAEAHRGAGRRFRWSCLVRFLLGQAVVKMMKMNKSLRKIIIPSNDIGDDGAKARCSIGSTGSRH